MATWRTTTSVILVGLAMASTAQAGKCGDFNGDGFDDLVVAVPGESTTSSRAGAVHVLYGSDSGARAIGDQFWHVEISGILGEANSSAFFGDSLAVGDFDGDGFDDLAIGAPNEDIVIGINDEKDDVVLNNVGAVHVLYGSSEGLRAAGDDLWHQDQPGIKDQAEEGDNFGRALAAADFDGDGFDDLAIAAFAEELGDIDDCGAVSVLYGSSSGLRAARDQHWHQNSPGIRDAAEDGDTFGWSLTAGDFDGDGFADLAVGMPFETIANTDSEGAVHVLYGSSSGLTSAGDQIWHQNVAGIKDVAELQDWFGTVIAAGDFDGDGCDDLAIGIDREDFGFVNASGAVAVIYGSSNGLTAAGDQFWHQNVAGIPGICDDSDEFGEALTAGDFDGDGRDDLAIGVLQDTVDGTGFSGAVHVLYGSSSGLRAVGDQYWDKFSPGLIDAQESSTVFGYELGVGDFDGNGFDDLVLARNDEIDGVPEAGAVHVLYGRNSGLSPVGDQYWHQNVAGIADSCEEEEGFGGAFP